MVFPYHKVAPRPQKQPDSAINNNNFCSDKRSGSCYIGNQPLYFQSQCGSLTTRALKIIQESKKITQKNSLSALTGDPMAVNLPTNHSIFMKWSQVRLLGFKMVYPDHKVILWLQKLPKLAKRRQKALKHFTFCSGGGSNSCYIDHQPLCFY